jgi:hypothetical protein
MDLRHPDEPAGWSIQPGAGRFGGLIFHEYRNALVLLWVRMRMLRV